MLEKFKALVCNTNLKVYFLLVHAHLDHFLEYLGDVSEEQGKRFHQDIKKIKKGTEEDGTLICYRIIDRCCTGKS